MEGVECESKASQEELEIKAKKNEIKVGPLYVSRNYSVQLVNYASPL